MSDHLRAPYRFDQFLGLKDILGFGCPSRIKVLLRWMDLDIQTLVYMKMKI